MKRQRPRLDPGPIPLSSPLARMLQAWTPAQGRGSTMFMLLWQDTALRRRRHLTVSRISSLDIVKIDSKGQEEAGFAIRLSIASVFLLVGFVLSYFVFEIVDAAGRGLHQWYLGIIIFMIFVNIGISTLRHSRVKNTLSFDSRCRGNRLDVGLLVLGLGFVVAILLGVPGNLYVTIGAWFIVLHGLVSSLLLKQGWVRGEPEPTPTKRSSLFVVGMSVALLLASIATGVEITNKHSEGFNVSFQLWFAIWFLGLTLVSVYRTWKLTRQEG